MGEQSIWLLPEELEQLAEQGESGLVQEVLAVFQTDTAERLTKLRNAVSSGDRTEVRNQAHAIKGSASQVGALAVAAFCQSLESKALAGPLPELRDLAGHLDTAFDD